jgi:hypothetical protein
MAKRAGIVVGLVSGRPTPQVRRRAADLGLDEVHLDVRDRPRLTGVSNYGFFDRLWVGILDLFGMMWLIRRASPRIPTDEES